MKLTSTKLYHRIYKVEHNGRTFEIDGQNHEYGSKEWELFEVVGGENVWIETYPTKKDALADIPGRA